MKNVELFDTLSNIKEELFDADNEVKSAFNKVVGYFASMDPVTGYLVVPDNREYYQIESLGNESKMRERDLKSHGKYFQKFHTQDSDVIFIYKDLKDPIKICPTKTEAQNYATWISRNTKYNAKIFEITDTYKMSSYE